MQLLPVMVRDTIVRIVAGPYRYRLTDYKPQFGRRSISHKHVKYLLLCGGCKSKSTNRRLFKAIDRCSLMCISYIGYGELVQQYDYIAHGVYRLGFEAVPHGQYGQNIRGENARTIIGAILSSPCGCCCYMF